MLTSKAKLGLNFPLHVQLYKGDNLLYIAPCNLEEDDNVSLNMSDYEPERGYKVVSVIDKNGNIKYQILEDKVSIIHWDQFQDEVHEWAMKNFDKPGNPHLSVHPLLGMIEELGELKEATLKHDKALVFDAVGDIFVYMADYCAMMNIDMGSIPFQVLRDTTSLSVITGRLCHYHLKLQQNIRGDALSHLHNIHCGLGYIIAYLAPICLVYEFVMSDAITQTWDDVKKRDWNKNKEDGNVG